MTLEQQEQKDRDAIAWLVSRTCYAASTDREVRRLKRFEKFGTIIEDIRGDVDDRTLHNRLVSIQGYLRHGKSELKIEEVAE